MSYYKIIKKGFTTFLNQNDFNKSSSFDTEFPTIVIKKAEKIQSLISVGDIVVAFKAKSIYKVARDVQEDSNFVYVYWNNGSREEVIAIPFASIKEIYIKDTLDNNSYFKIIEVENGEWRLTNENQKN